MKKEILLGSTALAAAGLLVAHAVAAGGLELEIRGRYMWAAGSAVSEDSSSSSGVAANDLRKYVFRQDFEVEFHGETVLDNGLTVGAIVKLEEQTSDAEVADVFAYFSGGFGELRFGDLEEAYAQLCYQVPSASELFGVDSPDFDFGNAGQNGFADTNTTCPGIDDNATKLVYFSPTFGGFTFAASWTPDSAGQDQYSGVPNANGPGGTSFDNNIGQVHDNFSGALSFSHDFEAASLVIGGGVSHAEWEATAIGQNSDDVTNYNAYFQVSFGGFLIGASGSYVDNWNSSNSSELDIWTAGAAIVYSWDAWSVGLGYSHGMYEMTDSSDHDTLDIVQIQASYALAEGISIDGMLGYTTYEDDNDDDNPPNDGDYDAVEAGVGFYIEF